MAAGGVVGQLAARIRAGDKLLNAWVGSTDPGIAEAHVAAGFDVVTFDMQHGAADIEVAFAGIVAVALAGRPSMVRLAVGDFAAAARLFDAGAAAVIAPMINSVADARELVDHVKFPPTGGRSWGPRRALALTGFDAPAYLKGANEHHLAIAMIETLGGYSRLDEILGVEGIDGVFVGPADLSIALCDGAAVTPTGATIEKELDHVAARAKAHGKFAATFCHNGARAGELLARGYAMCTVGTDMQLLQLGARTEMQAARGAAAG